MEANSPIHELVLVTIQEAGFSPTGWNLAILNTTRLLVTLAKMVAESRNQNWLALLLAWCRWCIAAAACPAQHRIRNAGSPRRAPFSSFRRFGG